MQEKWEVIKEIMKENIIMSKKEFWLITAVSVLSGILFGILISPRKSLVIGSNNGNNSGNYGNGAPEDGCEEEVEQIGVWEDMEEEAAEA